MVRIDIQNSHPSPGLFMLCQKYCMSTFEKKCSSTNLIFRIVVTLPFNWLKYLWIVQIKRNVPLLILKMCCYFSDQLYIEYCTGFLFVETLLTSSLGQLYAKSTDLPETFLVLLWSCSKLLLHLREILNQSYLNCFE